MAAFCRTCSISIFGEDYRELAELLPADSYTEEIGALALCECCGPLVVDRNGARISSFDPKCTCGDREPVEQPLRPYTPS